MEDERVAQERRVAHHRGFRCGDFFERIQQPLGRVILRACVHNHAILRASLPVIVFGEMARLDRTVHQRVIIRGCKFLRRAGGWKQRGQLPALGQNQTDSRRPVAPLRKIEKQHGKVQKTVVVVQNAREGPFFIRINGVADRERRTALRSRAPGFDIHTRQLQLLAVAIGTDVAHVSDEIANLVESVPRRELNLSPGRNVRHAHFNTHLVRVG